MEVPNKNLDFYKYRLEQCEPCEFNSVNYDISKNKAALGEAGIERVKNSLILGEDGTYFQKPFCTGCGCPIESRCAVKDLVCGLVEKPLLGEMKWGSVIAIVPSDKNFYVVLDSARNTQITPLSDSIYVAYEANEESIVDEVSFVVNCHQSFKFLQVVGTTSMERSVLVKTEDLSTPTLETINPDDDEDIKSAKQKENVKRMTALQNSNKENEFRNPIRVILKVPLRALPNEETTFNFDFKYVHALNPGVEKSFGIILFFRKNGKK